MSTSVPHKKRRVRARPGRRRHFVRLSSPSSLHHIIPHSSFCFYRFHHKEVLLNLQADSSPASSFGINVAGKPAETTWKVKMHLPPPSDLERLHAARARLQTPDGNAMTRLNKLRKHNRELDAEIKSMRVRIKFLMDQEKEFEKAIATAREQKDEVLARRLEKEQRDAMVELQQTFAKAKAAAASQAETQAEAEAEVRAGGSSVGALSGVGSPSSGRPSASPRGNNTSARVSLGHPSGVKPFAAPTRGPAPLRLDGTGGRRALLSATSRDPPPPPPGSGPSTTSSNTPDPNLDELPLSQGELETLWAELRQWMVADDGVDLGPPLADVISGGEGVFWDGALDQLAERWADPNEPLRDALMEADELTHGIIREAKTRRGTSHHGEVRGGGHVEVVQAGAWA